MQGSSIADGLQKQLQVYRDQALTGVVYISLHTAEESVEDGSDHCLNQIAICFVLGRITWVSSQTHRMRRWQRNVALYLPELFQKIAQHEELSPQAWNYSALVRLVKHKKLANQQLANVIESVVTENLFNLLQTLTLFANDISADSQVRSLSYRAYPKALTVLPPVTINSDRAWREATQQWSDWKKAGLKEYSPDNRPAIQNFEALRRRALPETLPVLKACCNNEHHTLRDLAIRMRQPTLLLTKSILPYVIEGMVAFQPLPDLAEQFDHGFSNELFAEADIADGGAPPTSAEHTTTDHKTGKLASKSTPVNSNSPTSSAPDIPYPKITYIDDSPSDSRVMSEIVEQLGGRYTPICDPMQALPMLLEIKPDLIFLDLVMPTANGYEVCAQIRRISAFEHVPVIILTSNDGVGDRARAQQVGASGFLGKPIKTEKVTKVLKQHLPQVTLNAANQTSTETETPILIPPVARPSSSNKRKRRARDFLFSRQLI